MKQFSSVMMTMNRDLQATLILFSYWYICIHVDLQLGIHNFTMMCNYIKNFDMSESSVNLKHIILQLIIQRYENIWIITTIHVQSTLNL